MAPRKKNLVVKDEITPQNAHARNLIAKERDERKRNATVEEWYSLNGKKIILHKRKALGSVYRSLVGFTDTNKSFYENLKRDGKL